MKLFFEYLIADSGSNCRKSWYHALGMRSVKLSRNTIILLHSFARWSRCERCCASSSLLRLLARSYCDCSPLVWSGPGSFLVSRLFPYYSTCEDDISMHQNARSTLVTLVEAHIRNLLIEALSVSRHCKRARVHETTSTAADGTRSGVGGDGGGVDGEDLTSSRVVVRRRIHAADVNMALQLLGSEKLYSTCAPPVEGSSQQKVNLVDFLQNEPMGNPPYEVGIQQHWLAVDGVQPNIPQNPSHHGQLPMTLSSSVPGGGTTTALADPDGGAGAGGGDVLQVNQLQTSLLSEELLLYYNRVTRVLYLFDRPSQQDAVLKRLATDPGLQELVPFLIRHCQHELYEAVAHSESERGRILVRLAHALLQNPYLHLELHLHLLLPALMTCVVTQQKSSHSNKLSASPSAWALRREASDVLTQACNVFGSEYSTLKSRVLKAFCQAMGPDKHLTSRYGGIVGLTAFGPKALSALLLQPALEWFAEFDATLDQADCTERDAVNIQMCQRALLDAVGKVLAASDVAPSMEMRVIQEAVGDKWVVFGCCDDDYAQCFI